MELSKLEEIKDLRKIWKQEKEFTDWLADKDDENISILGSACNLDISVEEIEKSIGDFRADIIARDNKSEKLIIIENQLEETNHDHLGKILTYASGIKANIIIWIVKNVRDEHRQAIEWLNENTGEDINFFLIKVKVYKIDNSHPAVKFEIIEQPNEWGKKMKKEKDDITSTQMARKEYWNMFNEYAFSNDNEFSKKFNKRTISTDHWMNFSVGSSAYHISVTQVRKENKLGVEWYISDNKEIYNKLYNSKEQIEKELGFSVEWMQLADKKASRIITYYKTDFEDRNAYPEQFQWIMNTAVKMKNVIKKYI